jgi:hypothetical protein
LTPDPFLGRLKLAVTGALGLWGEAGIGKSWTARRLLSETSCRSFSVHAAVTAAELLKVLPPSGPLGPRLVPVRRPARAPGWAERLLERLGRGEHAGISLTADALSAWLAALAPVVLHLEDLHEATPEGLELWQGLARGVVRSKGVALLATSRTLPPAPFKAVRLAPLEAGASRALLEAEAGTVLPPEAAAWIYGRARGNPLFTLEYFRYLARQGYLWNDAKRWHWRSPPSGLLPSTVEALIERSIYDAASQDAKEALEANAILPPDASEALWCEVAGLSPAALEEACQALQSRGLFAAGTFAHPLVREVAARNLTGPKRCELSRRALEHLMAEDPQAAAEFVDHADLAPESALSLLKRAAQAAKASGQELQAARHLAQATRYAGGEARGRLALEAARALATVNYLEATPLAELAASDLPEDGEAALLLAELLALQGRMVEAEALLACTPAGTRLERRIHLRALAADHVGVLTLWSDLQCSNAASGAELAAGAAVEVAAAMITHGDFGSARALAEHALSAAQSAAQRTRLSGILAEVAHCQGRFEEAVSLWSEQAARLREDGTLAELADCLKKRAGAFQSLGLFARKREDLEEAIRLYSELGDGRNFAATRVLLGVLFTELGDFDEAEEVLLGSREVLERAGSEAELVHCERMLCYLYRTVATPHGPILALKHGRAALHHARRLGSPQLVVNALYEVSCAQTQAGFPDHGLELAEEGLAMSEALGYPQVNAYCRYVRALALERLGRRDEALTDYRQGVVAVQALGLDMDAQNFGLEIDRLTGDVAGAARRLQWFEAHGHVKRAACVRRYFPELAGRSSPTGPEPPAALPCLDVLGPMQAVYHGVATPVRGQKRKELLALLLEARIAGRPEVCQLELLDALYPDELEEAAADALKQLVFQLRKGLGTSVIARTPSGYALGSVTSDAEDFLKSGDTRLWRGVYLEDAGSNGDETIASALYQALQARAAELLSGDPHEAARLGCLLLAADPYDVDRLRLTLRALRADGDHRKLNKLYGESRAHLAEVGERLPESWEHFLESPPAQAL